MVAEQMALVALQTEIGHAHQRILAFLDSVQKRHKFIQVSSLYKKKDTSARESNLMPLCLVVKFESMLSPEALLEWLEAETARLSDRQWQRVFSLDLLCYGQKALMTPRLTLPHADWHRSPELLIPSVEIHSQYFHPVLKKTLGELARDFKSPQPPVEFFESADQWTVG